MQKCALVIGGSGGIGSAIVTRLLLDGFWVCATSGKGGARARALEQALKGKSVSFYHMDLLAQEGATKAMEQILAVHPRLDVVVFCPTLPTVHSSLLASSWSDFEPHIAVQLRGAVEIVRTLREQIRAKHRTKFIFLESDACIGKPPSHMAAYVAAKYALLGLGKSMAVELARYGCSVNMVSPGMVKTELLSDFPAKAVELAAAENPMGAIVKPQDVANVVAYLASDAAGFLNGAHITINGGSVMV